MKMNHMLTEYSLAGKSSMTIIKNSNQEQQSEWKII